MTRDERGQALLLAAVLLALAALTLGGLQSLQERIVRAALDERAGEASVEAAGAVFADELASGADGAALLASPRVLERATAAAREVAAANGRERVGAPRLELRGAELVVTLELAGRPYRAAVTAGPRP